VEQKNKENYVKIVHELIKDSEVLPYKVASPFQAHESPYALAGQCLFKVILHWQAELLLWGLQIALGPSLKATSVTKILHKNFITVLMGFKKIPYQPVDKLEKDDKLSECYLVQELWPIQVYRLFGKILKAIGAAVPGSLPDMYAVALEMTVTANVGLVELACCCPAQVSLLFTT